MESFSPPHAPPSPITILWMGSSIDRERLLQIAPTAFDRPLEWLTAATATEGLEIWRSQSPDLVLMDLPDANGLRFLDDLHATLAPTVPAIKLPVIVLIETDQESWAEAALQQGAMDYLVKGAITPLAFQKSVAAVLAYQALAQQLSRHSHAAKSDGGVQNQESVTDIRDREDTEHKQSIADLRRYAEEVEDLYNNAPCGYHSLDAEGRLIRVNNTELQWLGYSREEMLGRSFVDFLTETSHSTFAKNFPQFVKTGQVKDLEFELICKDGSILPVLLSAMAFQDAEGKMLHSLSTMVDMRDRKRLELTLQTPEAKLHRILNEAKVSIVSSKVFADYTWDYDFYSAGCEAVFGYTPTEMMTGVWKSRILPEDQESLIQPAQAAIFAEQSVRLEYRFQHKNGSIRWVASDLSSSWDAQNHCWHVIAVDEDITDRKRLEQERDRYFAVSSDLQVITGNEGYFQWVSPTFEQVLGWTPTEMIAHPWTEFMHPDDVDVSIAETTTLLSGQTTFSFENRYRHKDGSYRWLLWKAQGYADEQVIYGAAIDITQRKQAELALQERESLLHLFAINAPVGIAMLDRDMNHLMVSQRWLDDFQLESFDACVGKSHYEVFPEIPERWRQIHQRCLAGAVERSDEDVFVRVDGTQQWVRWEVRPWYTATGDIGGIIIFSEDISQRKQAELALQELNQSLEQRITERTAELRTSQQFLQTILDTVPIAIFWKDRDFRYQGCNTMAPYFLKFDSPTFVIGKTDADLPWGTETVQMVQASDRQIMSTGEPILDVIQHYYLSDGSEVWMEVNKVPLCDLAGNIIGILGTAQDVTQRKQAELALQNLTDRLTLALEAGAIGTWDWNLALTGWNEQIEQAITSDEQLLRLYGYPPGASFSYEDWRHAIHADDIDALETLLQDTVRGEASYNKEFRIWRSDGELRWIQGVAILKRDASGTPIRMVGINQDITDRKRAEALILQQLQQQQALAQITAQVRESLNLDNILATVTQQVKGAMQGDRVIVFRLFPDGRSQIVEEAVAPEFTCLKNMHWDNETWSPDILEMYWQGQPRIVPDVMNDPWTDCLRDYSLVGQIQSKLIAPILQDNPLGEIHRWVNPRSKDKLWGILVIHACHEKRVWQDSEAQLLQQIANQVAIAIQQASLFDQLQAELQQRQQAQAKLSQINQQLAYSNEELGRATRMKDEFLANMSHELRTPLNAILGMTESLQEDIFGPVTERQIFALQTIERTGNHLLDLINDILDVSKIEAGKITLEYTQVNVQQLCESSLAFVRQQAIEKQIQLTMQVPPYPISLSADERRLRQILINLLNNAVKFTPEGGSVVFNVSIIAPLATSEPEPRPIRPGYTIRFSITDTGIGISTDNIGKLFQPFVQIDSALNRQYQGTGLGLALVKRLVNLHGGSVDLTSEPGVGSCFSVFLPFTPSFPLPDRPTPEFGAPESPPTPESVETVPLILLAEDNEDNIAALSAYLEVKGYRLLIAQDGEEAIALTQSEHPDLILMDIQMPKVDGLEAIRRIRSDSSLSPMPIIAITALAMAGDRDRCLAAGADDYLSKPIRMKQLAEVIQQWLP